MEKSGQFCSETIHLSLERLLSLALEKGVLRVAACAYIGALVLAYKLTLSALLIEG